MHIAEPAPLRWRWLAASTVLLPLGYWCLRAQALQVPSSSEPHQQAGSRFPRQWRGISETPACFRRAFALPTAPARGPLQWCWPCRPAGLERAYESAGSAFPERFVGDSWFDHHGEPSAATWRMLKHPPRRALL